MFSFKPVSLKPGLLGLSKTPKKVSNCTIEQGDQTREEKTVSPTHVCSDGEGRDSSG